MCKYVHIISVWTDWIKMTFFFPYLTLSFLSTSLTEPCKSIHHHPSRAFPTFYSSNLYINELINVLCIMNPHKITHNIDVEGKIQYALQNCLQIKTNKCCGCISIHPITQNYFWCSHLLSEVTCKYTCSWKTSVFLREQQHEDQ